MFLHKICFFVTKYLMFVSAVSFLENEGVPNNTSESAFHVIMRNTFISLNLTKHHLAIFYELQLTSKLHVCAR